MDDDLLQLASGPPVRSVVEALAGRSGSLDLLRLSEEAFDEGRMRAAVNLALEYDLSYLWRGWNGHGVERTGYQRPFALAVGVEVGLALDFASTDFGQSTALGLALDPYVEPRLVLEEGHLVIPLRIGAQLSVRGNVLSRLFAISGVGVTW